MTFCFSKLFEKSDNYLILIEKHLKFVYKTLLTLICLLNDVIIMTTNNVS
jgi:hypothetical protein